MTDYIAIVEALRDDLRNNANRWNLHGGLDAAAAEATTEADALDALLRDAQAYRDAVAGKTLILPPDRRTAQAMIWAAEGLLADPDFGREAK